MLTFVAPAHLVAAPQDFRWDPALRLHRHQSAPNNTVLVASDFRLRNDDTITATFTISFPEVPSGWQASTTVAQPIVVNPTALSAVIPFRVIIPPNTPNGCNNYRSRNAHRCDTKSDGRSGDSGDAGSPGAEYVASFRLSRSVQSREQLR